MNIHLPALMVDRGISASTAAARRDILNGAVSVRQGPVSVVLGAFDIEAAKLRGELFNGKKKHTPVRELCPCLSEIETMAFKGTGVCSIKCQKKYLGESTPERLLSSKLKQKLSELESGEHSTKSKDFGRGVAYTVKEIQSLL